MVDYYFAYGSNMNPARVESRRLVVRAVEGARVAGYRLVFDKSARDHAGVGHANLSWARDGRVEGVLYALADADEIRKMDVFERTPINYSRERIVVATDAGVRVAWTYFANPAVRRAGLRPDRDYLGQLLAGRPYLSADYFAWLAAHACVDD